MVALLFEVGGQRYGLDIAQVVKVLPFVRLHRLPHAPEYVAGVFCYRDAMVPVIDLSQLIRGTHVQALLSTRIVLVKYPGPSGTGRVLGLLAERATDSLNDEGAEPVPSGVAVPEAPYLGGLSVSGGTMIQYVKVENLLPDEVAERLFAENPA
ncbi:MAG: chemotaxis protein CheW [Candidatus Acidiferrales bacterium]|jgi:chemotaxis-related protein WspB